MFPPVGKFSARESEKGRNCLNGGLRGFLCRFLRPHFARGVIPLHKGFIDALKYKWFQGPKVLPKRKIGEVEGVVGAKGGGEGFVSNVLQQLKGSWCEAAVAVQDKGHKGAALLLGMSAVFGDFFLFFFNEDNHFS